MTLQQVTEIDLVETRSSIQPDEVELTVENADGEEWDLSDVHQPEEAARGNRTTTEECEAARDALEGGEEVWVDVAGLGRGDPEIGEFVVGRPAGL